MQDKLIEVNPIPYHPVAEQISHIWGWEIVVYLFLGGMVAGLLVLTGLIELRRHDPSARSRALQWMPVAALGLLSVGMAALFADLHYKLHFWRFYLAFRPTSPMSWGAWILLIIYPAALLLALGSLGDAARTRLRSHRMITGLRLSGMVSSAMTWADRHRRGVLYTCIAVGGGLGIYTGLLLGTLAARIQWNSAVLGPLFLASGISTGAAFMLLFDLSRQEQAMLVRWDIAAIIAELSFIALMLVSFAGGTEGAQTAAASFLGGKWTALFWSLVVIGGLVVPLLMNLYEVTRGLQLTLLSPILILIGGLALRAILLASGQETSFAALH